MKYLKRLKKEKETQYFHIIRQKEHSDIALMPNYLKKYLTEFNYLFEQIHECATADVNDKNHHSFYNFGNNARKFMEIYLAYKYPNEEMDESEKMQKFFGDQIAVIFSDRINNESSHLAGSFERGATPIDTPEMKISAATILKAIEKKDPDQYTALLESIGKSPNAPVSANAP